VELGLRLTWLHAKLNDTGPLDWHRLRCSSLTAAKPKESAIALDEEEERELVTGFRCEIRKPCRGSSLEEHWKWRLNVSAGEILGRVLWPGSSPLTCHRCAKPITFRRRLPAGASPRHGYDEIGSPAKGRAPACGGPFITTRPGRAATIIPGRAYVASGHPLNGQNGACGNGSTNERTETSR